MSRSLEVRPIWVSSGGPLLVEITDIKVYLVGEDKLRAFVSMVLDRCFMINDVKVIRGKDGLFVSMPSRRKKNGDFKDVAHPLNIETRSWMEERILDAYREALAHRDGGESVVGSVRSRRPAPELPSPGEQLVE